MRVTAARLIRHGQPLEVQEVELSEPGEEEVVLDIAYSGVNLVLFGTAAGPESRIPLQSLYRQDITVYGYAGLPESDETLRARIEEALKALACGQLSVPADSAVPLPQVDAAFERISRRDVRGKLVLDTHG